LKLSLKNAISLIGISLKIRKANITRANNESSRNGDVTTQKLCTQLLSNQVVKFWSKLKLLFGVHD
jgi:hypothetical protein